MNFLKDESAAIMAESAFLLAFVCIVGVFLLTTFVDRVIEPFQTVTSQLKGLTIIDKGK